MGRIEKPWMSRRQFIGVALAASAAAVGGKIIHEINKSIDAPLSPDMIRTDRAEYYALYESDHGNPPTVEDISKLPNDLNYYFYELQVRSDELQTKKPEEIYSLGARYSRVSTNQRFVIPEGHLDIHTKRGTSISLLGFQYTDNISSELADLGILQGLIDKAIPNLDNYGGEQLSLQSIKEKISDPETNHFIHFSSLMAAARLHHLADLRRFPEVMNKIGFTLGESHKDVSMLLHLPRLVVAQAIASYPREQLHQIAEHNGGLESLCTTLIMPPGGTSPMVLPMVDEVLHSTLHNRIHPPTQLAKGS